MHIYLEWLRYGIRKGTRFRANTVAWMLADIALYGSVLSMYFLLGLAFDQFGSYDQDEIGLYISTYFLVNNLFAVLFSEAVSQYYEKILDGTYLYGVLAPHGMFISVFLSNFNFPALVSTPLLLLINGFYVVQLSSQVTVLRLCLYAATILSSVLTLTFLFLLIFSLAFLGLRSGLLGGLISQCFSLAEKPDTVFPKFARYIFTYVLPAFMISAVPTRILLSRNNWGEALYCLLLPWILFLLFNKVEAVGLKTYNGVGG